MQILINFVVVRTYLMKFAQNFTKLPEVLNQAVIFRQFPLYSGKIWYSWNINIPTSFDIPVIFHIRTRSGFLIFDPEVSLVQPVGSWTIKATFTSPTRATTACARWTFGLMSRRAAANEPCKFYPLSVHRSPRLQQFAVWKLQNRGENIRQMWINWQWSFRNPKLRLDCNLIDVGANAE